MSRLSRIKVKKNSEKKEKFCSNGSKRKIIVNRTSSDIPKEKITKENEEKNIIEPQKQDYKKESTKPIIKKRKRVTFSKKINSSIEEDNTSFFDEDIFPDVDDSCLTDFHEKDEKNIGVSNHKKETISLSKNKDIPSFLPKKRRKFNNKKSLVTKDGKVEIKNSDNMENISDDDKNNKSDPFDFSLRPTPNFLNHTRKPDIIIRPYSSFAPDNGLYKKDTYQETSNIRFTESDVRLAESSGLSWD